MARTRPSSGFAGLRLQGGILPPDFLARVAARAEKYQKDADYGLTRSLALKDELARYWRIASDLYAAYAERRERRDLDPGRVGVAEWLVPLLRDVFGFADLAPARPVILEERSFPISHRALGGTVPVLLTTREFELDRGDPRFGSDGRRRSPHGLVQEFLNASPEAVWGIVANGTSLRILRDNPSLTRPAFIEADLELVFGEQLYADFTALWLLAHASRFRPRGGNPRDTILEEWRREAHETGQRALDGLRHGVARALKRLGNGFLQHRANERLREEVAAGRLSAERYFQELLRLVYRLLFLFTAEERDLVHAPGATAEQRELYARGYGLARLRERARKRRHYDHHHDLSEGLRILFRCLERGEPRLGLPALGGLFAHEHCRNLDEARIANADLLAAVHDLCFFETGAGLQRVNYRDMDSEELGSVYESLLELHPAIEVDATPWRFEFRGWSNGEASKGHERKLTGSYYTPAPLLHASIESALLPVMAAAVKARPEDPRAALLELAILDPACGSGHFLSAAARRLAAELARLESGTDVPDALVHRHALRQVVQRCLYGVDRNPLAVELCRTALWIETLEPGKPLTFLDARIRCGDSLVGVFDLARLDEGIPDAA